MLTVKKLKDFQSYAQESLPQLELLKTFADDDDVVEFTRDIKSSDGKQALFGVLPSFNLDFKDEDNFRFKNKLILFVVKKFDIKEGYDAFLDVFQETGETLYELIHWMFEEQSKGINCNPIFKEIDLKSIDGDPVRDYHNFYGYMIHFNIKTK